MHNPYAAPGISNTSENSHGANPYSSGVEIREVDDNAPYQPSLFTFNGRIGRLRFIAYSLPAVLLWGSAVALLESTVGPRPFSHLGWPQILLILLSMLPFMIIARRRLHDLNHSGRWLVLGFTPIFPILYFFLLLGAGTRGRNGFGPPPDENHPGVHAVALLVLFIILATITLPPYMAYQARHAVQQDR